MGGYLVLHRLHPAAHRPGGQRRHALGSAAGQKRLHSLTGGCRTRWVPGRPLLAKHRECHTSHVSCCLAGAGAQPCCHESPLPVCDSGQSEPGGCIQLLRYFVLLLFVILLHSYMSVFSRSPVDQQVLWIRGRKTTAQRLLDLKMKITVHF